MAFKGHLGSNYTGTGSLPLSTFGTFLDDIVADVSAANASGTANGWSLYDDQRNLTSTMNCGWIRGGGPSTLNALAQAITFTSASQQITITSNAGGPQLLEDLGSFASFGLEITSGTLAGATSSWYGVLGAASNASASITTAFTGTSRISVTYLRVTGAQAGHNYGYVVLKNTAGDGMRDLYVQIMRTPSYSTVCNVQAFSSWNSATHVGTDPGPQDVMRGHSTVATSSSAILYALNLLSGCFMLYTNGDSSTYQGDLVYHGNIDPTNGPTSDVSASVWASNHQTKSGFINAGRSTSFATTNAPQGGATMIKGFSNQTWVTGSQPYENTIELVPRGRVYIDDPTLSQLDLNSQFQMVGVDVIAGQQSATSANLLRRGGLRYLRYPLSWPSGMNLQKIAPADDGNDYLILRCNYPNRTQNQLITTLAICYQDSGGTTDCNVANGFCLAGCIQNFAGTFGEFLYSAMTANAKRNLRVFCIPTNL